ncbi:alpha/beta hydrolase [Rhodococcus sp. NPDC058532]|uniref:alpha/beta hydrolase n=1 Tax=Rhodococcus sp. NPDC058532 TaxID=3346540 RepID=UPI00364656CE
MGINRTFVGLPSSTAGRAGAGGHPCQGVYYAPEGRRPKVAVIATHYGIDFSEHYMSTYLAERGVGFLGWNTRFRGDEAHFLLDHALVDIGVGVRWLREVARVDTVILLGNSGGGSLMSVYQSQAVAPNVTPVAGMRPATGLDELPAADGYISTAAHLGRPDVLTAWMDGSVTDEADPISTDPTLDLFNPDNGPGYAPEFVERYRGAQVERNHRITRWVKDELRRVAAAGYTDRHFSVHRTWADPRMVDPTLEPTRREPNRCYVGVPERTNRSVFGIASACTLRTWLSLWSLEDSQTRSRPHLARITVPALVVNGDADTGVYPSDAADIVAHLGAADKEFHELHADHYFLNDGARDELADLVETWIEKRFG